MACCSERRANADEYARYVVQKGLVDSWDRPGQALGLFLRGRTLRTAAPTALIVGIVLCAVNQGSTLMDGQATTGTWLRMAFNFVVPFVVASVGYLAAHRRSRSARP
jgi:hypothetical protein